MNPPQIRNHTYAMQLCQNKCRNSTCGLLIGIFISLLYKHTKCIAAYTKGASVGKLYFLWEEDILWEGDSFQIIYKVIVNYPVR